MQYCDGIRRSTCNDLAFDCFGIDAQTVKVVQSVEAMVEAPVSPHKPVVLTLIGLAGRAKVWQVVKPTTITWA